MKLVVERNRFLKILKIASDKKSKRQWLYDASFIRMEVKKDRLLISGKAAEVELFAAVVTPGALFIRATARDLGFRRTGSLIPKALKSAINDAIRRGLLEYERDKVRRRS